MYGRYGGGQNKESAWPLEKGSHDFAPFVTGNVERYEWGNLSNFLEA